MFLRKLVWGIDSWKKIVPSPNLNQTGVTVTSQLHTESNCSCIAFLFHTKRTLTRLPDDKCMAGISFLSFIFFSLFFFFFCLNSLLNFSLALRWNNNRKPDFELCVYILDHDLVAVTRLFTWTYVDLLNYTSKSIASFITRTITRAGWRHRMTCQFINVVMNTRRCN